MALPAHLAKYDALVDLIVDVLVREIEQKATAAVPAISGDAAPVTRKTAERLDRAAGMEIRA